MNLGALGLGLTHEKRKAQTRNMDAATQATLFASRTGEWFTPQDFYDALNREFGFVLDAASTHENAKCDTHLTREDDALVHDWSMYGGAVWLNPPYGRGLRMWVEKALMESQRGATVVMLVPARTDTRWFHESVLGKAEIRFVRGRLKFGGSKNAAPFPSMVVIFRPHS